MRVSTFCVEFLLIVHGLVDIFRVAIVLEICPCVNTRGDDDESGMGGGMRSGLSE